MLNRVTAYFDSLYSPVALASDPQPPMGLWRFVFYFIVQNEYILFFLFNVYICIYR